MSESAIHMHIHGLTAHTRAAGVRVMNRFVCSQLTHTHRGAERASEREAIYLHNACPLH